MALGSKLPSAAAAAGVSQRTLRDWIERGEGRHPTRPLTPKLQRFARRYRQAQGETTVLSEHQLHEENPKAWLAYTARSLPDEEEAQSSVGAPAGLLQLAGLSEKELNQALARQLEVAAELVAKSRPARPSRARRGAA
jgi:hypothetical protein